MDELVAAVTGQLGIGPGWVAIIGAILIGLRGVAASVSENVPDKKLGPFAKILNFIGGNRKHAANTTDK